MSKRYFNSILLGLLILLVSSLFIFSCKPTSENDIYTLSVEVSPEGAGNVFIEPVKALYTENEEITLIANPNDGYSFSYWEGDVNNSNNPLTLIMDDNKSVNIVFEKIDIASGIVVNSDKGEIENGSQPGYVFDEIFYEENSSIGRFNISNTGTSPLLVEGMYIEGDENFSIQYNNLLPISLNNTDTFNFILNFNSNSAGKKQTIVNIKTNQGYFSFEVRGYVRGYPKIEISTDEGQYIPNTGEYVFSEVIDVDFTSEPINFNINNIGNDDLIIKGIKTDRESDEFILNKQELFNVVSPEQTTKFSLTLSPKTEGTKKIILIIETNDLINKLHYITVIAEARGYPEIDVVVDDINIINNTLTAYDFGSVVSGGGSPYVEFNIVNNGSSKLNIDNIEFFNPEYSYWYRDTDLVNIVEPGEQTKIYLLFYPSTPYTTKEASLKIYSNDRDESIFEFGVTGTVTPEYEPEIAMRQNDTFINVGDTFDFGDVKVEETKTNTFTILNLGWIHSQYNNILEIEDVYIESDTGSFSVDTTNMATLLTIDSEAYFDVTFSPTIVGKEIATVYIESNDLDEPVFSFDVVGQSYELPDIRVTHENEYIPEDGYYDFGSVNLGDFKKETLMIENNNNKNLLYVDDIILVQDDKQFIIEKDSSIVIKPNETSFINIIFEPVINDDSDATLLLYNNFNKVYTINLKGRGIISPDIVLEQNGNAISQGQIGYDFDTVYVGEQEKITFTVQNDGNQVLYLDEMQISDLYGQFSIDNYDTNKYVPMGSSTEFDVVYSPNRKGLFNAEIRIISNDKAKNPYVFNVVGSGFSQPGIEMVTGNGITILKDSPNAYNFNEVQLGFSETVEIFINNVGNDLLKINSISIIDGYNEQFVIDNSELSTNIPAGGSSSFSINYIPNNIGNKYAFIEVNSNVPRNEAFMFGVTGTTEVPTDDYLDFSGDEDDLNHWEDLIHDFIGDEDINWFEDNNGEIIVPLTGNAKVWVSFIFEEAGYKNRFGFINYENAPTSNNIDDYNKETVFDNASAEGSGGDLITGDTVFLGNFNPLEDNRDKLAFWLHQNGYNNSNNPYWWPFDEGNYGVDEDQLNVDSKKHMIMFTDADTHAPGEKGYIVMGIEDLTNLGDRDYDDIIVIITIEPEDSNTSFEDVVDTSNMITINELETYLQNN